MNVRRYLEDRLTAALRQAGGTEDAQAMVAPSTRPQFGDYQANGVMPVAKTLKTNPRKLAEKAADAAELAEAAEALDVAGPGFINVRLRDDWIAGRLRELLRDDRLGVEKPRTKQRVVVDYSAPNLAKEMHVGHLRSTIIGDALARTLDFIGHHVIRQNHVGDWGTQFGMLTAFLDLHDRADQSRTDVITKGVRIRDLEEFYQEAKRLYDSDEEFARLARQYVVKLQNGTDDHVREEWRRFVKLSWDHCAEVYLRLGVPLTPEHRRGESAYNDDLPKVVQALDEGGLLTESEGAKCVFLDEFKDADGNVLPVIVQKSDGGYLYATTDLAAVRYRVGELEADRILYVIDHRQSLHLRQVFAVARAAGWAGKDLSLEHVAFGTMLDPAGRPFKTREGGTVKLMDLLAEAEQRARAVVTAKSPDLPPGRADEIAHVVGIGAVKYADLSQNRTSDYVFSFDKMLSLDGNTAPYMQYAYARIRSIFRRGGLSADGLGDVKIALDASAERALGLKLLQLPEAVQAVADDCLPNMLCGYLYDLAVAFTGFYESCPVLKSPEPVRTGRLALCELTARTIRTALNLLGIDTVEQM